MSGRELRADWPACQARGLCHEVAPELITLDPWGYPLLPTEALDGARLDLAQDAVHACPRRALRLLDKTQ